MQCHILFTTVGCIVPALVILIVHYNAIDYVPVPVHVVHPYKFSRHSLIFYVYFYIALVIVLFSFRLGQLSQLVKSLTTLELDLVTHQSVSMILMLTQLTLLYSSCGELVVVMRYSETAGYFI